MSLFNSVCHTESSRRSSNCNIYRPFWATREFWFSSFTHGQMRTQQLMNNDQQIMEWQHKKVSKCWDNKLWKQPRDSWNNVQSLSDYYAVIGAREANAKEYEVVWSRLKSHDCVNTSQVVWICSINLQSTLSHFSFKCGHISWPQRLQVRGVFARGQERPLPRSGAPLRPSFETLLLMAS